MEGVQIKNNWKFKEINWEFLKFRNGISKRVKVQKSFVKFFFLLFFKLATFGYGAWGWLVDELPPSDFWVAQQRLGWKRATPLVLRTSSRGWISHPKGVAKTPSTAPYGWFSDCHYIQILVFFKIYIIFIYLSLVFFFLIKYIQFYLLSQTSLLILFQVF
jgi:hypothetical protein